MSKDIRVIVDAAVQRILKRELSDEEKKSLESDDIKRHLGESRLDFEVSSELDLNLTFTCISTAHRSSSDMQRQSRGAKKGVGMGGVRPVPNEGANTAAGKRQRLCRTQSDSFVRASAPPGMHRTTPPVWLQNPPECD